MPHAQQPNGKQHAGARERSYAHMQRWLQLAYDRAAVTTRQSCPPEHTDMAARGVCRSRGYPTHAGPQLATHHTQNALVMRATQTRLREGCAARAGIHHMRAATRDTSHSSSARCARDTDTAARGVCRSRGYPPHAGPKRATHHTQQVLAMRAQLARTCDA